MIAGNLGSPARGGGVNEWDDFEFRPSRGLSGYRRVEEPTPILAGFVDAREAGLAEPLRGITSDGMIRADLFPLDRAGRTETAPIVDAAESFLASLDAEATERLCFPLESDEKRRWLNVHPNLMRHGLLLADLSAEARRAALAIMEASLSARGYQQARDVMRLNGLLVELTGLSDEYGEWPYFFSLFGQPSRSEPWAWQIDGHHLNVNCLVFGDRLVLTPTFMGSEPCRVNEGSMAGTKVFGPEEQAGLDLIRALDDDQAARAVLRPSIHPDDLPADLQDVIDGRMQAGAFHDNAVIGYEGVAGRQLSDAQQRLLQRLIGTYVGWGRDDHAEVRMEEVVAHLDETHFAWMGSRQDRGPFYYRVQSPVVLIEFDHHPGIVWSNRVPTANHVHTIVRTPNGGDYGVDLLRQHYERYDHSTGTHRPHEHSSQTHG